MSRYEQKVNRKSSPVLMIVVVMIVAVFAVWLYQQNKQSTDREVQTIDVPMAKPAYDSGKKELPVVDGTARVGLDKSLSNESVEQNVVKPTVIKLEESDDVFRKDLGNISESLLVWFQVKDVIRKYILLINDLSQNQILYKHRKFLKMPQKFVVKEDAQGLYIGKESYARYDQLANAISSIDVQKGLDLYLTFRPLFKQVYDEFGYPAEYQLEDIFMKAAASVIEAPIVNGRVSLRRYSVGYKFAEAKLEVLNGVEKQMLRMGPGNTQKIQAKLRQLVEAISVLNE